MKKKYEVRHIVTAVASVPIYKAYGKTETYRQAAKDGWGTVCRDEKNNLFCDEDCSASLYTKNGGYFGIFPYEEINTKEMPKQAECAAIIVSDSCGFTFWAEDFNQIHIFVTYDENGLVDTYRVEYGDSPIYDGETEISFEDLVAAEAWEEAYRVEIPGTVEYQRKQEAAEVAAQAAATAEAGGLMEIPCCQVHGVQLIHRKSGTAEQEYCGTWYTCPEGGCGYTVLLPSAEISQQTEGTAAEAASEGQKTALGTPDDMAGTDATEAAGGQQAAPQAGEIDLGKLNAGTRPEAGDGLRKLKPEPP